MVLFLLQLKTLHLDNLYQLKLRFEIQISILPSSALSSCSTGAFSTGLAICFVDGLLFSLWTDLIFLLALSFLVTCFIWDLFISGFWELLILFIRFWIAGCLVGTGCFVKTSLCSVFISFYRFRLNCIISSDKNNYH